MRWILKILKRKNELQGVKILVRIGKRRKILF
mgnify:CR=1 FL=1|jgi:hypothetical protein